MIGYIARIANGVGGCSILQALKPSPDPASRASHPPAEEPDKKTRLGSVMLFVISRKWLE